MKGISWAAIVIAIVSVLALPFVLIHDKRQRESRARDALGDDANCNAESRTVTCVWRGRVYLCIDGDPTVCAVQTFAPAAESP